jgi:hypothetical protein
MFLEGEAGGGTLAAPPLVKDFLHGRKNTKIKVSIYVGIFNLTSQSNKNVKFLQTAY